MNGYGRQGDLFSCELTECQLVSVIVTPAQIPSSSARLSIGGFFRNGRSYSGYNGLIDEVRIYNYALPAADVAAVAGVAPDLQIAGKMAVSTNRDGNGEEYTMNPDGTGATRLTNDPGLDHPGRWSPDGTQLTWFTDRDGNWEIYVVNANGSSPTRLTNTAAMDTTQMIGGRPRRVRPTVVVQPGDTLRVRVVDEDLADSVIVGVRNPRTGESETVRLGVVDGLDSVFYGRAYTESGSGSGPAGDERVRITKADSLVVTYTDTLTAGGGVDTLRWIARAVDPFGDADGNGQVQAYDAAKVLFHRLHPYLAGVDSLSANLDSLAPFSSITAYDAALILQKRVGRINRFPVQTPWSVNQPQPESTGTPKPAAEDRLVEVRQGDGYVGVWMEERSGVVSGEVELAGARGPVKLGDGLGEFLIAWDDTNNGLRVVFAGAEGVSGPGELLRIESGVGPTRVQLTRVALNDGMIGVQLGSGTQGLAPRRFVLSGAVPNPFNPSTVIRYELPEASQVRLEVYSAVGQRLRVLVAGERAAAGVFSVEWDGRDDCGRPVSSGVYLCRLQAGQFRDVRKMVPVR